MSKRAWQLLVAVLAVVAFGIGFETMGAAAPDTPEKQEDPSRSPTTAHPPEGNEPVLEACKADQLSALQLQPEATDDGWKATVELSYFGGKCTFATKPTLAFDPEGEKQEFRKTDGKHTLTLIGNGTVTATATWRSEKSGKGCSYVPLKLAVFTSPGSFVGFNWPQNDSGPVCDMALELSNFAIKTN